MDEYEIRIRLLDAGFAYSVVADGRIVESGTVGTEEEVAPGYYGGSEAMD